MLSVTHAQGLARDVMETSDAAYLTTIGPDGFPLTRAMLNLRNRKQYPYLARLFDEHEDDFLVYFTTNTSSAKVNQILINPQVSVYYCLPDSWRGLCLRGNICLIDAPDLKEALWQRNWELYYPEGPGDPDYAILAFTPVYADYYHQLERAEWSFTSLQS